MPPYAAYRCQSLIEQLMLMALKNLCLWLVCLFLCYASLLSCSGSKKIVDFEKQLDRAEYHAIAKEKGITNDVWTDRLYSYKVNISKFDEFYTQGVDLKLIYGMDYRSRSLLTDAIIEGKIISKTENASTDVMFHTAYEVVVEDVIKKFDHRLADTILLKVISGPVGDKYMALIAGVDRYEVGEKAIIYLEAMERTFKSYEERGSERLKSVNSDRNNTNIFRPLKKYLVKNDYIYERTNGKIEKKKKAVRALRKLDKLNRRF